MEQRLRRIHGCTALSLLLGSLLLARLAAAQPGLSLTDAPLAPGTFRLTVTAGEISLTAHEASLAAILQEIGQRTGIAVHVAPGADETITTHFAHVPLRDALKRLAKNVAIVSTLTTDAPPHRVANVYVFRPGDAEPGQVGGRPAPSSAATANEAAARPEPFQFTFDPAQHLKPAQ